MREIKFRAWDRHTKTYSYFDFSNPVFDDNENSVSFEATPVLGDRDPDGDRFTFQQYTGLHDKNGREIYEGDLLKISMQGDEQTNSFQVENMWDLRVGMENADAYLRIDRDVEVIGNIYENPELLTV